MTSILKDGRFAAPEAPVFESLVDGLRRTYDSDAELLDRGIAFFEAMYRAFRAATNDAEATRGPHRRSPKVSRAKRR